jgi:hypothetical protein
MDNGQQQGKNLNPWDKANARDKEYADFRKIMEPKKINFRDLYPMNRGF